MHFAGRYRGKKTKKWWKIWCFQKIFFSIHRWSFQTWATYKIWLSASFSTSWLSKSRKLHTLGQNSCHHAPIKITRLQKCHIRHGIVWCPAFKTRQAMSGLVLQKSEVPSHQKLQWKLLPQSYPLRRSIGLYQNRLTEVRFKFRQSSPLILGFNSWSGRIMCGYIQEVEKKFNVG